MRNFLAGGFGGVCLVMAGQPLDLMKVKLQTGTAFNGIKDVALHTLRSEGPLGFYRGVSAPLLGATPLFAVCFWGYDLGLKIVRQAQGLPPGGEVGIRGIMAAGAFSALPTTFLTAPVERIKCLLQMQGLEVAEGRPAKYSGMFDCAKQLFKVGGLSSVYRGWEITLVRDIPGSVAYFGVNEALRKHWTGSDGAASAAAILTAGGVAGMANWAVAIPADVIKSRLQTAPEGKYTGFLSVYRTLMKEEGAQALFRGFGPAMLRAFPANAACFFGVDIAKRVLERVGI
ncbi:unnamed protein product [Chrysoparadoxa australica]